MVTTRSAVFTTVVVTESLLFAAIGSLVSVVTEEVLVMIVPLGFALLAVTTITNVAAALAVNAARAYQCAVIFATVSENAAE